MMYFRFRRLVFISGFILLFTVAPAQYSADSLRLVLQTSESKAGVYNLLAEATIGDSLELSMAYARLALQHAGLEKNTREKGVALFSIAEVFSYRFKLDSAINYYRKALTYLTEAGDDFYISYTHNNLGWIYNHYGKYPEAVESYTQSLAHLDTEAFPEELPNLYINIGNSYHHMGSYHTAIDYFHKAIGEIKKMDDKTVLPIALNGIGLAWKYIGNFDSAVYYYDTMLEIDKMSGTPLDVAIDLGNIGALYYDWGMFEQSYRFHTEATGIFLKEGNKNHISVAYNNMGEVHKALKQYDSSLFYLKKALELDRQTGIEHNMAMRYNNIGDVYLERKAYNTAMDFYQQALEINNRMDSPYNVAMTLNNIAKVNLLTQDFASAAELYLESLGIARRIESKTLIAEILKSLADLYAEMGQPENAYRYHVLHVELKERIFRENNRQLLADLQARHDLDQKEKAIALLNAENRQRTSQAQRYQTTTYFFGFAFLIITVLLVLMLYQYNLRKKAYKKLVQKNKELAATQKGQLVSTEENEKDAETMQLTEGFPNHRELRKRLKICLKDDKPYLNPDLSARELAQQLNTNTHYLSEVINTEFGNNFTGIINEYRVKEACKLLADKSKQNLTIESIAYEAGFKSKSAFNNAFKTVTGLTPSYYRKSVKIS